jgi:hypothetical protein
MSEYAVPISLLRAAAFVDLLASEMPNPDVSTLAPGDESGLPQKHKTPHSL